MKKYRSNYYKFPIIVEDVWWEKIVSIKTINNKKIIYSMYDLEEKTSYSTYIKNAILASFIWNIPKNILIIWFGAGSYAKYFIDYLWNKVKITRIEIDNWMLEIAKNDFWLKNNINYFNLDYILALNILEKQNKKFDIVFFDVYDNNWKIPNSFDNIEIIIKIKNILWNSWIFLVNFADYKENIQFYQNIERKILQVFSSKNIKILNNKNDYSNIIWVYNLKKKINSQDLILNYLQKVKSGLINYDSNLIKKVFID